MDAFTEQVLQIWTAGGPLMIPLALLGLAIYFVIGETIFYLMKHDFRRTPPDVWGHWIEAPQDGEGKLGDLIRFSQHGVRNASDVRARFAEIREAYVPAIRQRIKYATVLVGAAPLMGLLGTVAGMLSTFLGMSVSTGGTKIDLVASGISEALITTQTGLVVAIPGYVLIAVLKAQATQFEHFLHRLETATTVRLDQRRPQLAIA